MYILPLVPNTDDMIMSEYQKSGDQLKLIGHGHGQGVMVEMHRSLFESTSRKAPMQCINHLLAGWNKVFTMLHFW